jgi:hypothetical protein
VSAIFKFSSPIKLEIKENTENKTQLVEFSEFRYRDRAQQDIFNKKIKISFADSYYHQVMKLNLSVLQMNEL